MVHAEADRHTSQNGRTIPALLTKALIREFYLRVGERTLDRWIASRRFPRPDISIGGKVRLWKRETVEAWIERQVEGGRA